eukprot:GHVR01006466.1.p1 GENE.GHVR01006466.1~~GHVR01006466.1.p1  ORF type:complete len:111 (+),score=19.21 GHVR01006466.1:46-378(+)
MTIETARNVEEHEKARQQLQDKLSEMDERLRMGEDDRKKAENTTEESAHIGYDYIGSIFDNMMVLVFYTVDIVLYLHCIYLLYFFFFSSDSIGRKNKIKKYILYINFIIF